LDRIPLKKLPDCIFKETATAIRNANSLKHGIRLFVISANSVRHLIGLVSFLTISATQLVSMFWWNNLFR